MRDPTPAVCAAIGCDQPREAGKFYCAQHTAVPPKGEVKRLEARAVGNKARSSITNLFIIGILVTGLGVFVAGISQSTYSVTEAGLVQTGNDAGYALGLFVVALGSMLSFIAVVAWGVMLGMRAARD